MKKRRNGTCHRALAFAFALILACGLSLPFQAMAEKSTPSVPEYQNFEELKGRTISMLTGAPFEELVSEYVSDVNKFTYFNNTPDMLLALKDGKTDAALTNNAIADLAVNRDHALVLFPQSLQSQMFGFAFPKGSKDRDKWQTAYESIDDQTKQELWEKWTGADDSAKVLPGQDWPEKKGTVRQG